MCVHLCDCNLASRQVMQKRRTQLLPRRLPVWSTSWQQLLTDPTRTAATAISAPWPVSSRHEAHFWDLSRAPPRYLGLNSGNWFVNILKRGSAADSKPVILHFQSIFRSCWTADYSTCRNHLTTVSCCCGVATFQKLNKIIIMPI